MIHTPEELAEALSAGRPDMLYWLSHATPDALELDGAAVEPLPNSSGRRATLANWLTRPDCHSATGRRAPAALPRRRLRPLRQAES